MVVIWDNPPSQMGVRFKEEIVLIGLDEESIVERRIVSRQQLTTMLHGSFDNVDGAALKRLANQGVDIQYILTGKKSLLKPEESALVENYRGSTSENKRILRDVSFAITKQKVIDDENCA